MNPFRFVPAVVVVAVAACSAPEPAPELAASWSGRSIAVVRELDDHESVTRMALALRAADDDTLVAVLGTFACELTFTRDGVDPSAFNVGATRCADDTTGELVIVSEGRLWESDTGESFAILLAGEVIDSDEKSQPFHLRAHVTR